jgi:hypothetical protein
MIDAFFRVLGGLLIPRPYLGLLPALVLAVGYQQSRNRMVGMAAMA